jgi:hypothetical protein
MILFKKRIFLSEPGPNLDVERLVLNAQLLKLVRNVRIILQELLELLFISVYVDIEGRAWHMSS